MGFEEEAFRDTEMDLIRQAMGMDKDGRATRPDMEHVTLQGLEEMGHLPLGFHRDPEGRPFQPYVRGPLLTPSGKIEFYAEALAGQGLDPLPGFQPAVESRFGELAKRYPLEFLGRKADNYMNSTFANLDGHRKMEVRTNQRLEMHPVDAAFRGIVDGTAVMVWNDRGTVELCALLNPSLPPGVVAGKLDWGKLSTNGTNVNALTSERLTDLGAGATFYSTLVEVKKAEA
jgi:anaerobic selenocysteine-containing dehydrogenase